MRRIQLHIINDDCRKGFQVKNWNLYFGMPLCR